ncbi:YchJ family protein [Rhodoferax sp.]|uniref:YchJ family protein n=1 Tax=Rhodoferax sp. TaxID=50421 RepID=UPI002763489B|nr:YchJ family metal-binding protein [Rhodoferax sp.]
MSAEPMARTLRCPCGQTDARGKALTLAQCCARFITPDLGTPAPDAPSLMRSRYSAFVLQDVHYLLATWHASSRPPELMLEPGVKWLGLELRQQQVIDATHAEVEFVARQRDASGRAHRLHEHSRFVREQGRWFYVDGTVE